MTVNRPSRPMTVSDVNVSYRDDVGFHNFGFRGNQEARTPTFDALVSQGVLLDRAYVYKVLEFTLSLRNSDAVWHSVMQISCLSILFGGLQLSLDLILSVLLSDSQQLPLGSASHSRK